MKFCEVIVDITSEQVDRPFTYIIPEHLEQVLFIGMEVNIPFGKSNKLRQGFVTDIREKCDYPVDKLKYIDSICEKSTKLETSLIELALWMSREYGSTLIQALKTVLPVKEKVKKRGAVEEITDIPENIPPLNVEQSAVYERIVSDHDAGHKENYLLYGITGSGKTLVYMNLAKAFLERGMRSIVLIPEISLTEQTIGRFRQIFGSRVGVIHSRLSNGRKYEIFEKARQGELDVVIGPRSALFVPLRDLGLIIIDEEHESSYKSEKAPCYHAREVAFYLAQKSRAQVVLGSATPSVTSYYYATHKDCAHPLTLLKLPHRASGAELAEVSVIDMREELRNGNREMISEALDEAIRQALARKEQIMLFLNRRGYAGFVSCRSCGYTIKCDHCDVSMSYHKGGIMRCHYCGAARKKPTVCPECGSKHISTFKIGTEQLEEYLKSKYPEARILRMDADTTRAKDDYAKILGTFRQGKADILIGTQMIVKGHDFPNVTVAAALAADMSLNSGDYMSAERTYDLLAQAAGRAGRDELKGRMFIQTYNPENYAIKAAKDQDYEAFYRSEMIYRSMMSYPPASHLLKIMISSRDEDMLETAMDYFFEQASRFKERYKYVLIGPAQPYAKKLKDSYRKLLYIKSDDYDILIKLKDYLERYFEINDGFRGMMLKFDFDPIGD